MNEDVFREISEGISGWIAEKNSKGNPERTFVEEEIWFCRNVSKRIRGQIFEIISGSFLETISRGCPYESLEEEFLNKFGMNVKIGGKLLNKSVYKFVKEYLNQFLKKKGRMISENCEEISEPAYNIMFGKILKESVEQFSKSEENLSSLKKLAEFPENFIGRLMNRVHTEIFHGICSEIIERILGEIVMELMKGFPKESVEGYSEIVGYYNISMVFREVFANRYHLHLDLIR